MLYKFEEDHPTNILQARRRPAARARSRPPAPLPAGARRRPRAQGHDEIVWAVEVAGQRLFSASADKTIRVWDIESRRCEQARPRDRGRPARRAPGAPAPRAGRQPIPTLTLTSQQVLEDHTRPVLSLAVTDKKLFSGSYDYTIKVWSLDSLQRLKTLTGAPAGPPLVRLHCAQREGCLGRASAASA